jgi:anti-sigma regulatory factor (Ser/Thr protein kinase)
MTLSSLQIPVREEGQAGEARRKVAAWTKSSGFSEDLAGRVTLVATELAKNLHLHASEGGSLVIRRVDSSANAGVTLLSLDAGPGVENFGRCLQDGYSTSGTSGIGLGSVQRIAHRLDVHSQRGTGTALLVELWAKHPSPLSSADGAMVGAVSVPIRGEVECGDSWAEQHGNGWSRFMVADGLGHGPIASEAAEAAKRVFESGSALPLSALLKQMHERLKGTRGAAVAVAHVDRAQGQVYYAGIGNIAAAVITAGKSSSMISHNGTVGAAMPSQPREFQYSWGNSSLLIMNSDGLKSQWQLDRYAGLAGRHPELIAGVLYRDFARGTDDVTVLVARERE